MIRVNILQFKSTNLLREFDSLEFIDMEFFEKEGAEGYNDTPHYSSAGGNYRCFNVNGRPIQYPQEIRIFWRENDNEMPEPFKQLSKIQNNFLLFQMLSEEGQASPFAEQGFFRLIPQFTFKGSIGNSIVWGYAHHLLTHEWASIAAVQDRLINPEENFRFYNLSAQSKHAFAEELIAGYKLLNACELVIGNINSHDILVNTRTGESALAGYDKLWMTGQIVLLPDISYDAWLPQEINKQNKYPADTFIATAEMGYWTAAVALHSIFFQISPYDFLKSNDSAAISSYLHTQRWPENESSDASRGRCHYKEYPGSLPVLWFSAFVQSFNSGYTAPGRRLNYESWSKIIGTEIAGVDVSSVVQPAPGVKFTADKDVIIRGMPVILKWAIEGNADHLSISDVGIVNDLREIEVWPDCDKSYTLTVANSGGTTVEKVAIIVYPKPVIENISLPEFDLALFTNYDIPEILLPALEIAVEDPVVQLPGLEIDLDIALSIPEPDFNLPIHDFKIPDWTFIKNENIEFAAEDILVTAGIGQYETKRYIFSKIYKKVITRLKKWK